MQAQLASLPEALRATVEPANKRQFLRVHVFVLNEVLLERKRLATKPAGEGLALLVYEQHMSAKREARVQALLTILNGAKENFLFFFLSVVHFIIHIYIF